MRREMKDRLGETTVEEGLIGEDLKETLRQGERQFLAVPIDADMSHSLMERSGHDKSLQEGEYLTLNDESNAFLYHGPSGHELVVSSFPGVYDDDE